MGKYLGPSPCVLMEDSQGTNTFLSRLTKLFFCIYLEVGLKSKCYG